MMRSRKQIRCRDAKQIDIVDYLGNLGHEVKKIRGNNYWFLSPLRNEKTASFKVDRSRNHWHDFGEGKGGNFIDFAILYYRCTVSQLLAILNGHKELKCIRPAPGTEAIIENKIVVTEIRPLSHPALLLYCSNRYVDPIVAARYCGQAYFNNNGKKYFAICFKNSLGGYELRNAYFKGGSSPKGFTVIENGSNCLAVFEGFFDFLSYLMLLPSWDFPSTDFLILNSLSFFEQALPVMHKYSEVNLFLDNNAAGKICTQKALSGYARFSDQSIRYSNHEDLNEYLCSLVTNDGNDKSIILKPP